MLIFPLNSVFYSEESFDRDSQRLQSVESEGTGYRKVSCEFETKYVFDNRHSRVVISWLKSHCLPDPKYSAGIISSIYYDSQDWRFLREKINSDFHKTKIRIRWYREIGADQPGEQSFLEIKHKIGGQRVKNRYPAEMSGRWLEQVRLEDQKLLRVRRQLRAEGIFFENPVWPMFALRYQRFRFIEPITKARICVDSDISVFRTNRHFLQRSSSHSVSHAVLEVKGAIKYLPETLRALTEIGNCRKQSFSKYLACYQKVTGIVL